MNSTSVFRFVGVSFIVVVVISLMGWFLSKGSDSQVDEPESSVESTFSLSDSDLTKVNDVYSRFVNNTYTYGLVDSVQLNAETVRKISGIVYTGDTSTISDFWRTRQESVDSVTGILASRSPLLASIPDEFVTEFENSQVSTVNVVDISSLHVSDGTQVVVNDSVVERVNVSAHVDVAVKRRVPSANDSDWDGSFKVFSKTFPLNVELTLEKNTQGEWKVYDFNVSSKQFSNTDVEPLNSMKVMTIPIPQPLIHDYSEDGVLK